MVLDELKDAERTWREIVSLATPIDRNKPVILGCNPKSSSSFDAYTDDRTIHININNEKAFQKEFEDIILPIYRIASEKVYDVSSPASESELMTNLLLDTFLFIHFHEQLHPWLCPNGPEDEKAINKALFSGIREAEPKLSPAQAFYKTNNCKNLVWDTVLNVSFVEKTSVNNHEDLEEKIRFVFRKNGRKIDRQSIQHYPTGILPILYLVSASERRTDIPISLIGQMYSSVSFNERSLRQAAFDVFHEDLKSKGIDEQDSMELLKKTFGGFVSEITSAALKKSGIEKSEYLARANSLADLSRSDYELNAKYLVASLTRIFDSFDLRYPSLKGFVKVLSPYIRLDQKQGSPDANTKGPSSGGAGGNAGQDSGEDSEGAKGAGAGSGGDDMEGKSQGDIDADSMEQTLSDLLGELDPKDADNLLGELANNPGGGRGAGNGNPSAAVIKRVSIQAADEYYKRNATVIKVQNSSEDNVSFELGPESRWKLVRSEILTPDQVSRLNHQQILNFQKRTGLPVLFDIGNGFQRMNEYRIIKTSRRSYSTQKSGIEIPDNWVIIQDSSGSMTSTKQYVNSRNSFDLLNRVKYGLMNGLYTVCKEMGRDLWFGVSDFSDVTRYAGMDSLIKLYESRAHPIKDVSLIPQCGGTTLNSNVFEKIQKDMVPGKSVISLITDGEISGSTDSIYDQVVKYSSKPDSAFVFVEIGMHTSFGQEIKELSVKRHSVLYYSVSDINSIKDKLGSILITYG